MFGLAEYFKRSLLDSIKGDYCVLFDESLNNMVKEKQMDIHVRYGNESRNHLETRYIGSEFLGKLF